MGWLSNHNDGKERVIVALSITLGISALVGLLGSSWTEPNFATYASVAAFASVPHIVLAARTRKVQTDQLQSIQEEAEATRATLVRLTEQLPIGFVSFADHKVDYVNPKAVQLLGADSESTDVQQLFRSIGATATAHLQEAIEDCRTNLASVLMEFRVESGPNNIRHISFEATAIANERSNQAQVVAFLRDLTERRTYESELRDRQEKLTESNELLHRAVFNLERHLEAMVHTLVKTVEAKDPYTAGHSERVMAYALWIAETMGLSSEERHDLKVGCLMHDIGKIGIPDSILTKPDKLTDDEFRRVKEHPTIGARILEGIPTFAGCIPVVRDHHERLNGRGYPNGLTADELPMIVRIASVADAFDAMTSTRAYRQGMSAEDALKQLQADVMSGAFDPEVVATFAEIVRSKGYHWIETSLAA